MRLLLIQVPTSHLGIGERVYPLGLARLAGILAPNITVQGLDMNMYPDPWSLLKDRLCNFHPHVVVLSFRNLDPLAGQQTSYLSCLKTSARVVHSLLPKVKIIVGGPAFSLFAQRLMTEIPELDMGIVGEGEPVFNSLLSCNGKMQDLPGLVWRRNGRVIKNPIGRKWDLDHLPMLNTTIFNPSDYLKGNKYVAAVGIEGKRGCDLKCAYCVYPIVGGRRMRLRTPAKIVDEMEMLNKAHGVELFHFTDSVLNRPMEHFTALCKELRKRKLKVCWTGFFREDHLNRELVQLAMQAGLVAIYFSGDALTQKGLSALKKGMAKSQLIQAAKITAACDILTMCHFLVNLPGEDHAQAQEAIDTLDRILDIHAAAGNLGAVILNTIRLYPGAPLTRRLQREGMIDPRRDLLYPVYFNPPQTAHRLHQLETRCHLAGVLARLDIPPDSNKEVR